MGRYGIQDLERVEFSFGEKKKKKKMENRKEQEIRKNGEKKDLRRYVKCRKKGGKYN